VANPNAEHETYMRRAITCARRVPLLPFGAVIVDRQAGEVLAEGYNRSAENPTWHGEIDAVNRCAAAHPGVAWERLTLYTTAEPCPMCQGAVAWCGIGTVVFGSSIAYLKRLGWWQIDIPAAEMIARTPFRSCTLIGGVLQAECDALFAAAGAWQGPSS
jgi:tRNA(adenine34) deaminase